MDVRRVCDFEDFEFFAAFEACLDPRRGIGAQHPLLWAGVRATGDFDVERPVFLHRAAAHARELTNAHGASSCRGAQESFEAGAGVGGVKVHD